MSSAAELERALHYPLADRLPPRGGAIEVAPGVLWLRMSLPYALDHINLWLLRDHIDGRDGWSVVDCCIDRAESRADWEQVFASQLQGLPILRVIAPTGAASPCLRMVPGARLFHREWGYPIR